MVGSWIPIPVSATCLCQRISLLEGALAVAKLAKSFDSSLRKRGRLSLLHTKSKTALANLAARWAGGGLRRRELAALDREQLLLKRFVAGLALQTPLQVFDGLIEVPQVNQRVGQLTTKPILRRRGPHGALETAERLFGLLQLQIRLICVLPQLGRAGGVLRLISNTGETACVC